MVGATALALSSSNKQGSDEIINSTQEESVNTENTEVMEVETVEAPATSTTEAKVEVEGEVAVPAKPITTTEPVVVTAPKTESAPTPTLEPAAPSGITMAMVATHADAVSCWSVINGSVYDLTSYIPKHPGGKGEILAICGEDGSRLFEGQHGGESKPERILATYFVAELSR